MARNVFHLAFPVDDIDATVVFYRDVLGLKVDLVEHNRCIIAFGGHQLVAHLSPASCSDRASMYPRHFGLIFDGIDEFTKVHKNAQANKAPFFRDCFTRFANTPREHKTFFLVDPSKNVLEFKWYKEPEYILKSAM